jgi:hypothetical protein
MPADWREVNNGRQPETATAVLVNILGPVVGLSVGSGGEGFEDE